ncbi:c-type cytochrome [Aequorivita marina]|uniref:c-type cytochrome n=1 Tax=Aequorivita marina TaxID=3073654 RepID=UPI002874B7E7|nr:c-type cytochrome [Aequorivita sp. S2608]MDS1296842.1 c-type cytochrome [Aequorivita sp. S2608]
MVDPREQKARKIAIWIIGVMIIVWTVLGVLSFVDSEDRVRPQTTAVTFSDQNALQGKQVWQTYNCMDCHTIVGNGAYFAPDLTNIYDDAGPAYLLAYLGSPASYPSEGLVNIQLQQLIKSGESEVTDLSDYYSKYLKAESRVKERGGTDALMPNLPFTKDEINALIAFFKYTSDLNTAGWPPEVRARESVIEETKRKLEKKSGIILAGNTEEPTNLENALPGSPRGNGIRVAKDMGCIACHSTDGTVVIGPSWKGLYGSTVLLEEGKKAVADEDYLRRSILQPDEELVDGFQKGLMPSYEGAISNEDLSDLIEYLKSLN